MGKDMRFLESDSTPEEDSFTYSLEWDKVIDMATDATSGKGNKICNNYQSAWDAFYDLKKDKKFIYLGLKLFRIAKDGSKILWKDK